MTRRKRPAVVGYLVLHKMTPYRDASVSYLRALERGRLFYPSGQCTIWPTRSKAISAMRRARRAWGDTGRHAEGWSVLAVRKARPLPLIRSCDV